MSAIPYFASQEATLTHVLPNTMKTLTALLLLILALSTRADLPATEFFAIDTAKLTQLAPTDGALVGLSSSRLSEISIAHGYYGGGLSMVFNTSTFRIDARFTESADLTAQGPVSLGYKISASNNPESWSLLSASGSVIKQGNQFITENWRKQPVTIILRSLNLKK
jgi:hypothetical protein